MTPEEKREFVFNAYPGDAWKQRVREMPEAQIHTVFMRIKNAKKRDSR